MAAKDPDFAGTLKIIWDTKLSRTPNLMLVLCGSVSSWIESNILQGPDFVGRITLSHFLQPMPLPDVVKFWGKHEKRISTYEKIKLLSVTGGIPRYLEEIDPTQSAEANIHRLCFRPEGFLFNEFDHIFSDIFSRRSIIYREIVETLVSHRLTSAEIAKKTRRPQNKDLSTYLHDLEISGFITKEASFDYLGKPGKMSRYRLSDNYLRFYLKYIKPNRDRIKKGIFSKVSLESLQGWEAILGYQFENLVLANLPRIIDLLELSNTEVLQAGPYIQTKTARQTGCQIDLLVTTKFQTLYLGEIKFKKNISKQIINELEKKNKVLKKPKNFSVRPFLIYGGSLEELDQGYFDKIISADDLFLPNISD